MNDYQLERLNARSFEQLIQAIGLEVIGKQLMIFGDGPDGGREATFDGITSFPKKKPWNGCGILQAKFRQQPDSVAKKNADWAISQLKLEFKKLKPRTKSKKGSATNERVCPEYYVFATNLSLSAVSKKGGKDRIKEVLDGYKKSHGLKDYAIWDGNQIRRFLDVYLSIRTTYAAWILSGDVLMEMMNFLHLEKTDFPATIRRYLESELLDDQFAKLGQGGYTDSNAVPLSRVFVDLPIDATSTKFPSKENLENLTTALTPENITETSNRRPTFLKFFFEEGRQVLRPSANIRQPNQNSTNRYTPGRIVLVGGPGQGKTTAGQFACQLLRAALLKATNAIYSQEVTLALSRIEQQAKELPQSQVLRYPLRIDLKRLAEALAGEGDTPANSVLDYLVTYISKRSDCELKKGEFRSWLKTYPWLLVLDGLDEVPASSNRTKMMDAIRDFVAIEAHQLDADLLILATTRPQGYSDEFDPSHYCHIPLTPLNASEALEYGTKLAEARHPDLKSRIEELTKSLTRATTNPATVRLMESPLQVTIMLALIEGGGEPPEQRWKLFHDYYDVIYRREKERGTPFSALLGKYEPDIHWLHHRAGWMLQQRNATAGATAARLSHLEFEELVNNRLLTRGHKNSEERKQLVGSIRNAATDRLVFLVGNTANEIGFEIRSLQEFMAAEHCFDGNEFCIKSTIKAIAPYPYWRNVFLFAAGRIFFEKESLIDSLVVICEQLNETLTDNGYGEIAAGSRLALAMLTDGVARNQPENSRVLARCAARLLEAPVMDEISELPELCKGDAGDVWREEILKRLQTYDETYAPAFWKTCIKLSGNEIDWISEFIESKYPWHDPNVMESTAQLIWGHHAIPKVFWDALEKNIFGCAPVAVARLLRPGRKHSNIKSPSTIMDLRMIIHHAYSSSENSIFMTDSAGKKTINKLSKPDGTFTKKWAELELPKFDAARVHPGWELLRLVSDFSRELSPENLARQLSKLETTRPTPELIDSARFPGFPWQFRICLTAISSGMEIPKIISSIKEGKLGNADDWLLWSDRKSDIKISELGFPSGLISASKDLQGALYSSMGWSHASGNLSLDIEFISIVTEAIPTLLPGSPVTDNLINLCCYGINSHSHDHVNDWIADYAEIIMKFVIRCQESKIPLTLDIIAAIMRSPLQTKTKVDLLAVIGNKFSARRHWLFEWETYSSTINENALQVIHALKGRSDAPAVLVSLSHLPPLPYAKEIPTDMLEKCRQKDSQSSQAADVLQLNQLNWSVPVEKIATKLLSLKSTYPDYLDKFLDYIDTCGASGFHLEALLITLIKEPELEWALKQRGARLLIKLVERRPVIDSLPDPTMSLISAN